jgi:hypothetical protein
METNKQTRYSMEVSSQLHGPAALALSRTSTLLEEKAGCTPEVVWTFQTTEKIPSPAGIG